VGPLLLEGPFFHVQCSAGSQPKFLQFPKASPFFAGSCTPVACPAHSTGNNIPGGCDCLAGAMVEWVEKLLTIVTDFPQKNTLLNGGFFLVENIATITDFSFPELMKFNFELCTETSVDFWIILFWNGDSFLGNHIIITKHSSESSYYLTTSRCETTFVFFKPSF